MIKRIYLQYVGDPLLTTFGHNRSGMLQDKRTRRSRCLFTRSNKRPIKTSHWIICIEMPRAKNQRRSWFQFRALVLTESSQAFRFSFPELGPRLCTVFCEARFLFWAYLSIQKLHICVVRLVNELSTGRKCKFKKEKFQILLLLSLVSLLQNKM